MNYWKTDLQIGTLALPRFIGGPLDALTDEPFRRVSRMFCKQSLHYTEIRHVAAITKMPANKIHIAANTRPLNVQMTAGSTDYIEQACERIQEMGVDCIDINIGCPAPHIIKSGAGSALMADIHRLKTIVQKFRLCCKVPLTVKMRAGFKEVNAHDVALCLQDCGVNAIAVHPRLQKQKFRGYPDYSLLTAIKKLVSIPVLVSGGIVDIQSARAVYEQTGVDGFLVGRGQLGNPWILKLLAQQSQDIAYKPDDALVHKAMIEHVKLLESYYGAKGLPLAKRHIGFYVKNKSNAQSIRRAIHSCSTWQEITEKIKSLVKGL